MTDNTTPRQWSVTSDGLTIYKDNGLDGHKTVVMLLPLADVSPNPDGQFIIDCVNNYYTMRNALIEIREMVQHRTNCIDVLTKATNGLRTIKER